MINGASNTESILTRILVRTHLWLGISAALCTWGTFLLVQQPVNFIYLLFVLTGTMAVYGIHSYFSAKELANEHAATEDFSSELKIFLLCSSIATIIGYFFLNRSIQYIVLIPGLLAILYDFPFYKGKRLKDFPFVKIIAIVIAWTIITYGVSLQNIPQWWGEVGYLFLMADRLLFFFALAIPFDVRDIQYDLDHSIKTIPNSIGLVKSEYLALFSLFCAGGFMTMGVLELGIDPEIQTGLIFVYMLLGIFIIQVKRAPQQPFYSWLVDGILFLYGLIILLLKGI